jgi:hypothetical protein
MESDEALFVSSAFFMESDEAFAIFFFSLNSFDNKLTE